MCAIILLTHFRYLLVIVISCGELRSTCPRAVHRIRTSCGPAMGQWQGWVGRVDDNMILLCKNVSRRGKGRVYVKYLSGGIRGEIVLYCNLD